MTSPEAGAFLVAIVETALPAAVISSVVDSGFNRGVFRPFGDHVDIVILHAVSKIGELDFQRDFLVGGIGEIKPEAVGLGLRDPVFRLFQLIRLLDAQLDGAAGGGAEESEGASAARDREAQEERGAEEGDEGELHCVGLA